MKKNKISKWTTIWELSSGNWESISIVQIVCTVNMYVHTTFSIDGLRGGNSTNFLRTTKWKKRSITMEICAYYSFSFHFVIFKTNYNWNHFVPSHFCEQICLRYAFWDFTFCIDALSDSRDDHDQMQQLQFRCSKWREKKKDEKKNNHNKSGYGIYESQCESVTLCVLDSLFFFVNAPEQTYFLRFRSEKKMCEMWNDVIQHLIFFSVLLSLYSMCSCLSSMLFCLDLLMC